MTRPAEETREIPADKAAREPAPEGRDASPAPPAAPARTPPDPTPLPEPGPDGNHDLARPEYYLNRELTWLNFNFRVLHEAEDERTPLLERAKFLSIVGSNLDEFFMKRIGGLKQQVGAGIHSRTVDGRSPRQQIADCYDLIHVLLGRLDEAFHAILDLLRERDIEMLTWPEVTEDERSWLRSHYLRNIFPLVTPQSTDPAHPFPFISNLSLNLLVTLRYPNDPIPALARVKVPVGSGIPRFVQIPGSRRFVTLESVMAGNLDLLFPEMVIESCELFRVTRNANTEMREDRANDLLEMIETGLRERKFAPIVRLEVGRDMTPVHRGMLAAELGLDEAADVFECEGLLGFRDLMEVTRLEDAELHDPPHQPEDHPKLRSERSIFHLIRDNGPFLLHHPYESFATAVERLLLEASVDPKVRAIKMTIYRTSEHSKAVESLIEAAHNGKQVAVVVELKARFDEAANISWANRLEEAGIHVTYGVLGLKTHCKAILVVRQDYDGLRRYAHVGTGNYHAGTARLYSDLGMLTCDDLIGQDLTELFNYLSTGFRPKRHYQKILPAPKILKRELLAKIEREAALHRKEGQGLIRFKMNALEDADVTRALYAAAQAGVRVELFVRDSCRLRPGIAGLSENVTVVSVVGRFLEHARLYYFRNGGAEEYYIGSADCMKRNLSSRVELVTPVEDPLLRAELANLLDIQMADHRSAWVMQPDGSYVQRTPAKAGRAESSHEMLIEHARRRTFEVTRLRRRSARGVDRRRRP